MTDRMKWLKGWLKLRHYDIGSSRKSFIFTYYCTLLVLYPQKLARQMVLTMNSRLVEPLDDYAVKSIIRTVNVNHGYRQQNSTIVDTLGITAAEVDALRIGHNLKEIAEREQRQHDRLARDEKIIEKYMSGYRTSEIADVLPDISTRTIERVIQEHARQKKLDRNTRMAV